MTVKRGRPPGKVERIAALLRSRLENGEWSPGHLLPAEPELSRQLAVSRMTLRGALDDLEKAGLIVRQQGKGTFASEKAAAGSRGRLTLAILLGAPDEPQEEDAYAKQLSHGMQTALADSGFACTIHSHPAHESLSDFIREHESLALGWGGLLVSSNCVDAAGLDWLRSNGIPVAGLSAPPNGLEMPTVDVDNELGGRLAMAHLLERGWRRPVVLDQFENSSFAQARARGFRAALAAAGVDREERFFVHNELIRTPRAQELTARLLDPLLAADAIDSVIVYMEQPTIGVYRAIERRGLRVGRDIAVVHYNDYPWLCEVLHPRPTAVRQPFERVAYEATLLLQRRMRGEGSDHLASIVQPELILRESSPPQRG